MNHPSKMPVAVIGVGRMGRHHARLYHEMPDVDLLAVVDADEERAATIADEYACAVCTHVDQLLQQFPHLQAASVAVNTSAHRDVARALLSHKVACLVEKPLAGSGDVARHIVDVAEANNALLQVGHTERFNPAVRAVSDLGLRPRFIEVDRISQMTFRSVDVGVVFDLMIHDIDIVLMMAQSPIREIRAAGVVVIGEYEDVANARIEFEDGCVVNLTASRLALKTERKLRVFSESAYISLDYAQKRGLMLSRTGNVAALDEIRDQVAAGTDLTDLDYSDLVNVQELTIVDEEPLRAELDNFINAVRGNSNPEVDARAGLAAVETAERVVQAIKEHKWHGLDSARPI